MIDYHELIHRYEVLTDTKIRKGTTWERLTQKFPLLQKMFYFGKIAGISPHNMFFNPEQTIIHDRHKQVFLDLVKDEWTLKLHGEEVTHKTFTMAKQDLAKKLKEAYATNY
jgi:hypothetical protein